MKRNLFILLAFIPAICMGQQSSGFELPKNEISVSVGTPSGVGYLVYTFTGLFKAIGDAIEQSTSDMYWHGAYSVEYGRRFKPWFTLSGQINYEGIGFRNYTDESKTIRNGNSDLSLIGIAPKVRFSYLNRPAVTLYSGLSAGVGISVFSDKENDVSTQVYPHFNLNVLGINVGRKFYGLAEFNLGFEQLAKVGIGYKF